MSRSGYSEGYFPLWRGMIASATKGKRGQAFFRALVESLDAMAVKRLVANELQTTDGEVCTLGAIGRHQGKPMDTIDTNDHAALGKAFDIAEGLAQEVMYVNDELGPYGGTETPEQRWVRVRKWAEDQIRRPPSGSTTGEAAK